jgi:ribosomal protein S12 methylthiotransferase accessory factor
VSGAAAITDWVASSPTVDGVLFGPSDGQVAGPPVCAVAVAHGFRGFGKGLTQSDALVSAVGEALEQYSASQVRQEQLIRATFREICGEAFDPRWLCLYSDEQYGRPGFPYRRFDPEKPMHWTPGRWLDHDEAVWLPAFATYLNGGFEKEALCQVTSNGLAAGTSVQDAARRAALELYERDAFLTSWIALRPGVPIAVDGLDPPIAEITEHLQSRGAKIEVYLVAQGTPAFVAVCVGLGDGHKWPAVTLGLGAGAEVHGAVNKAILEHGQTGPFLARIWRNREVAIPAAPEEIRTLQDHALYYCDSNHAPEFNRWRNHCRSAEMKICGPERDIQPTLPEVRIAIAELTPAELADSPFRVVRAVARGLQPIYWGHGFERTFTPRLRALLKFREPNPAHPPIC